MNAAAAVVGRHVVYNNSSFDGNDPATKYGEGSGLYRTTDGGASFAVERNGRHAERAVLQPHVDAGLGVLEDGGAIVRHRPHLGARIIFSVIRLGFDAMFVPGGNSEGDVNGETVVDGSSLQQQYTFSVGLDF